MKVIIATDGSKYSQAAVESLCSRQWPSESHFLVLSVAEPLISVLDPMLAPYECAALVDIRKQHDEFAETAAAEIRRHLPNCRTIAEVVDGNAADQIVHKATEWGADFIIVGSHGRSGLEKFLLGSVAEAVVSRAGCSVEVIKVARIPHSLAEQKSATIQVSA